MIVTAPVAEEYPPLPDVSILDVVGTDTPLRRKTVKEYAGPCPLCRAGEDRFVVFLDNNRWLCRVCSPLGGQPVNYIMEHEGRDFPAAADRLREMAGQTIPSKPAASRDQGTYTHYHYQEERARDLFRVVRHDTAAGKRIHQERPDPARPGRWLSGLGDARRVLFRLPELLAADPTVPVYIVEGEKCVLALVGLGYTATCNPGGTGMGWRREYSAHLKGRTVAILPDNDEEGRKHAGKVAAALHGVASVVKVVTLPDLAPKGDVYDWLQAGHTHVELDALIVAAPVWEPPAATEGAKTGEGGLPDIPITDRHLRDVVSDAQAALSAANDPPSLFTLGGIPARTRRDEADLLCADQLSVDALRGELSKRANFLAYDRRRKSWKPAFPPVDMVRTVLAAAEHPLPRLAGFVGTPVMRPDGTLLDSPGYCRQTFLIYDPAPSLRIPAIAAAPSAREANFAAAYLADELMPDFPFVDDASRAHAIAKLILPFARELIDGPTPLHLVEAPECGSGKGLLDDVTALPAFGTGLSGITEPGDDDEWRKTLISALRGGSRYLRIDNLTLPLESGTLASALTAHVFEGRVLGGSQMARFRVRWVWSATANNPVLSSDIARRTVRIRIDPKEEKPWLRSGFRHTDLRGWAVSHRGELIAAALTMIRAWIVAGRPAGQNATLGSYESWSGVMGGILHHAGIDGFLGGLRDAYSEVDRELDAWRGLVHRWHETYGTKPVEASTLFAQAAAVAEIDLGAGNERSQRINFGKLLGRQQGRVIAGFRIEKGTLKHGMQQWLLVAV